MGGTPAIADPGASEAVVDVDVAVFPDEDDEELDDPADGEGECGVGVFTGRLVAGEELCVTV